MLGKNQIDLQNSRALNSFQNQDNNPQIRDTSRFECSSHIKPNGPRDKPNLMFDCDGIVKGNNEVSWFSESGMENKSILRIEFHGTFLISKLELIQERHGSFKSVDVWSSENTNRINWDLSYGPKLKVNEKQISPPRQVTNIFIQTKDYYPLPHDLPVPVDSPTGKSKYGIKELHFYGRKIQTPCKMKKLEHYPRPYKFKWIVKLETETILLFNRRDASANFVILGCHGRSLKRDYI